MDVFTETKKLRFPIDEYVIIGGAALAARGIKETRDIDIVVSQKLITELRKEKFWHYHPRIIETEEAGLVNSSGTVELYPTVGGIPTLSFDDLRKRAEIIDGIPFASLQDVRLIKETYRRDKDLKDLAFIEQYLNT